MFNIIQNCCQGEYAAYEITQISRWSKKLKAGFALDVTLVAVGSILCALTLCAHFNVPLGLLSCLNCIPIPALIVPAVAVLLIIILDSAKLFSKCCEKKTTEEKPKPQKPKIVRQRLPHRESVAASFSERSEHPEISASRPNIINLEKAMSKTKVRPSWEKVRTNIDGTTPSASEEASQSDHLNSSGSIAVR